MKVIWSRSLTVVLLGVICTFSLPGSVSAGLTEDEDAILDPVREQVLALQSEFVGRALDALNGVAEEFIAKIPNPISRNLKSGATAIARIEKDSAKTARLMEKAVNKGVVRAERANGSKELFAELEELRVMAHDLEEQAPLLYTQLLYEAFGEAYGFVP